MGESETLEFKETLAQLKKAVISIVSILNKHKKGRIIFGIKDNGEVKGVSIGRTTLRDIEPKIYPEIKEEIIEGKKCIIISFSGEGAPYFAYGRAYKRVSDEDKPLTKAELGKIILSQNKDKLRWDIQTNADYSLQDISDKKIKEYIKSIGLNYTSKKEVLKKLNLIKNDELTNASIILFGKSPAQYFHLLNLRCAVFSGADKASSFIDMKEFHGDLFELIESAQQYILQHINVGMKLEGLKRIDVPEINMGAIREAIINAFCHRDYNINQEVQVAIFKDRVEILNPGRLFGGLKVKDILSKPVSLRRNELIADIFHRIQYVEKWGTGIGKIMELEPETAFEEVGDFFLVTFKRKNVPKTTQKTTQKILELLKKNPKLSRKELAELIGNITEDGIKYNPEKLKKEGKIERVGSDKGGYWKVSE